jgi:riboflavin biosynthesis pyrimidine reductase
VKQPCNNPQARIARFKPAIQLPPTVQLRHGIDFIDARGLSDALLEAGHEASPGLLHLQDLDETYQIFIDPIFVGSARR